MTVSALLAAIAAIGSIVSGVVWLVNRLGGTGQQAAQKIDETIETEKDSVAKGGRPQW